MNLTIIVSHTKDHVYLYHTLDILNRIGFCKDQIWVDGYYDRCKNLGSKYRILDHSLPHGERSYDLLMEANTEFVIIMDSDFLCADSAFWDEALIKIKNNPVVAIRKPWYLGIELLTTPFVGYQRQAVLEMVPVRKAWNHFSLTMPGLTNTVFDHMCYVFFTAMCLKKYSAVDTWHRKDRLFKFCHLWDSRHTYEENFKDFDRKKDVNTYVYLSHGISKYIFHYVAGKIPVFEERVWNYMSEIMSYQGVLYDEQYPWTFRDQLPSDYLLDTMANLETQIDFKSGWVERFKGIKSRFEHEYERQIQ